VEAIVGMMIPIIGIIGGLLLAYAAQVKDHRRRQMMHEERMRALELGIELPPWPEDEGGDPYGNLKAAVVLMFLGGAFLLSAGVEQDDGLLVPTFIFFGLGLSFLLIHLMVPKAAFRKKSPQEPMSFVRRDMPQSGSSTAITTLEPPTH